MLTVLNCLGLIHGFPAISMRFFFIFSLYTLSTHAESYIYVDPYSEDVRFPHAPYDEMSKYIGDIIGYAKKNNKYLKIKPSCLECMKNTMGQLNEGLPMKNFFLPKNWKNCIFKDVKNGLIISSRSISHNWVNISHKNIEFIPKNMFRKYAQISVTYKLGRKKHMIYDEDFGLWAATVIGQAKRLKSGVSLNVEKVDSIDNQKSLKFSDILKLSVPKAKQDIADTPIFFY